MVCDEVIQDWSGTYMGEIEIIQNDSQTLSWDFPVAEFGDFSDKVAKFKAAGAIESNVIGPVELTVADPGTEDQAATLNLSGENTAVAPGHYRFAIVLDPEGPNRHTVKFGCLDVRESLLGAPA